MNKITDEAMIRTLDLPEATVRWLQSEAEAQGTDVPTIVREQLAIARARAEARAILDGPFSSLAESNGRFRLKYGFPDLSHISREEVDRRIVEGLAEVDPACLAEAERQGLF